MVARKIKQGHFLKNLLILSATGAGILFIIVLVVFLFYASQVPDPTAIAARRVSESTKIYDRTGQTLLYDVHGEEKRTIIPWEEIPSSIKNSTLMAEDVDFYNHSGVDVKGILRALYKDALNLNASQGGSTITQQLIKNSLLGGEKTLGRKIKEAVLSIQVERKYSKDQIFWMYLNQIPYGSNAYGIEAASQTYFGKPAKDLDIAESAYLAALPQAPTYYSPYGNHVDDLVARKNYILDNLKSHNLITADEYQIAKNEVPQFKKPANNFEAPHFVIMVRDYLIKKYGEDMVENGGLIVTTTLDTNLQSTAENLVTKYGKINTEKYKASNLALVSADPRTGQILAMVGSHDYFDIEHEGNFNVATALRQPGSSFKPFAYATLLEHGFTDSTVLFDLKTEFNPYCSSSATQDTDQYGLKCYHPQNYDGLYRGPVTLRQALDESLNIPSVKVLYLAGIDNTVKTASDMGITSLGDGKNFGLSLVLGGAEVKLTDMVSAYGVFANDGIKEGQSFILKVTTGDGTILEEYKKDEERVLDPQIARLMSDILSDNNARAPVFGYNNSLHLADRPVAAKTGTTQDNRDGWVLGYTPSLVTGVWTGNNDNSSMTKAGAGISAAGPLWHDFMTQALKGTGVEEFIKPDPVVTDKIMLNGTYNGPVGIHSILYYVDKNNPQGPSPSDPSSDPQFKNWEASVMSWFGATNPSPQETSSPSPSPF